MRTKKKIRLKKSSKNILLFWIVVIYLTFYLSLTCSLGGQAFGNQDSYTEVVVKKGDTLWDLAEKHSSKNQDIRKTIYEIKKLNNLTEPYLKPGDLLIIP